MGVRSRAAKSSKATAKAKATATQKPQEPPATVPEVSLWKKVFDTEAILTPREVLDIMHWIRQILAIFLGLMFGFLQLTGLPFVMSFIVTSLSTPVAFLGVFHEIDNDEVAKVGTMQTEGLLPAGALFLLTWTMTYTVFLPPS